MTRLASLATCGALLAAAPATALAAPIVGGSADSGDPAVVMLAAYPSDQSTLFTCTAIVISPMHLLTAAHCVDHDGYTFGVLYGDDGTGTLAQLEPQLAAVTAVHIDPQYDRTAPFFADIAVVDLAVATTVPPLAYATTAPTQAMVGGAVRIIGYGETVDQVNAAKKEQASTVIAALDPVDTITIGDATQHTCLGDSGGPAIMSTGSGDIVLGVDSYSDTSGCDGPSHFRRTDAFLAFIANPEAGAADAGVGGGDATIPQDAGTGSNANSGGSGGGGCAAGDSAGLGCALGLGAVFAKRRRSRVAAVR